jgi:hypothetical protein
MAGAVVDEKHSKPLLVAMLSWLTSKATTFVVDTALGGICVWTQNTQQRNRSKVMGLTVDLRGPSCFACTFVQNYPLRILRSLRFLSDSADSHSAGYPVISEGNGVVVIHAFSYNVRHLQPRRLCALPDPIFLQHLSTTPENEPAHFCPNLKEALLFADRTPPSQLPKLSCFSYTEGRWMEVSEEEHRS